ncbi:hypothetical protein NFI96_002579 [Prochilodus magdalenae]|nr:hypothetical protein NFI96_002579 [Prochilodus magdalenae]
MFLHRTEQANERSLVLFDSIWSRENSLVDCITSNNQAVTDSYMSKCWEAGGRLFSETPDRRFNISELVEPIGPCVAVDRLAGLRTSVRRSRDLESVDRNAASIGQDSGESSGPKLRRSKRAWMIPGTLWCGAGNKALNFSDLGMFEETDKCCREHDHCKDIIESFGFNFGVFNTNIFTLSHCDCDTKFRSCLHKVNNTMSNMVGYGYFNVLKMRCFEFSQRMECGERTWWGILCWKPLIHYWLSSVLYNAHRRCQESQWRTVDSVWCTDGIQYRLTSDTKDGLTTDTKDKLTSHTKDRCTTDTCKRLTTDTKDRPTTYTKDRFTTDTNKRFTSKLQACESYKDLDSCHHQIPAMQEKFGLRNTEFTILYHCNCTARLAKEFARQDKVDEVHSLLLDFVSQFCFILPLNCTDESCSVSSAKAPLLQRWTKDVAGGRPLVSAKRKIKRLNSKRSKRKDSSFRLYKKCLRMHSKLQKHRAPSEKLQDHGMDHSLDLGIGPRSIQKAAVAQTHRSMLKLYPGASTEGGIYFSISRLMLRRPAKGEACFHFPRNAPRPPDLSEAEGICVGKNVKTNGCLE